MSRFSSWSVGARLITAGCVSLLLSFGLCNLDERVMGFGVLAFGLSCLPFFVGVVALLLGRLSK